MKRAVFILVLIFLFCGCGKAIKPSANDVAKVYSKDFSAVAEKKNMVMDISKNGTSISFTAKYPKEVEGLCVLLSDEHAKVEFEGMTQEINTESLPEKAPFLLLDELFESLSNPEDFSLSTENDKIIAANDDFTAVLSEEDYSVITAVFPQYDAEFTFSEWNFLSEE